MGALLVPVGCSRAPGRARGTGGSGAGTHEPPTLSGMSPVTRPVMLLTPLYASVTPPASEELFPGFTAERANSGSLRY